MESWVQVPLVTWLSSLCVEQGINLSSEGGKKELRPSLKWEGGERPVGTGSIVWGRGSPVSPLSPMALDRCSGLCPCIGPGLGAATG